MGRAGNVHKYFLWNSTQVTQEVLNVSDGYDGVEIAPNDKRWNADLIGNHRVPSPIQRTGGAIPNGSPYHACGTPRASERIGVQKRSRDDGAKLRRELILAADLGVPVRKER